MPSDLEHLASAGIDAETGNPVGAESTSSPSPTESATVSNTEAALSVEGTSPAPVSAPKEKTASQKAVEMFELSGQRFPVDTKFKLTHGGKILEVPYSSLVNNFRQSQHLNDKWNNEYKPKIDEWEKTRPQFEQYKGFYDKYGALQEWSEKNPEEWASLFDYWQNRNEHLLAAKMGLGASSGPAGTNEASTLPHMQPLVEKIAKLEKTLEERDQKYSKYTDQFEKQQQEKQEHHDVEAVKGEIHAFQKDYPEINLDERNPDGVALWAEIVQFGLQNGYTDFEPAARMYLKQRIADTYASRALKGSKQVVKQDRKDGVIKRSATPFQRGQEPSVRSAGNVRNKSYGDLAEEAKAELAALMASGT